MKYLCSWTGLLNRPAVGAVSVFPPLIYQNISHHIFPLLVSCSSFLFLIFTTHQSAIFKNIFSVKNTVCYFCQWGSLDKNKQPKLPMKIHRIDSGRSVNGWGDLSRFYPCYLWSCSLTSVLTFWLSPGRRPSETHRYSEQNHRCLWVWTFLWNILAKWCIKVPSSLDILMQKCCTLNWKSYRQFNNLNETRTGFLQRGGGYSQELDSPWYSKVQKHICCTGWHRLASSVQFKGISITESCQV